MRYNHMHSVLLFSVVAAWILSGCTKSITSTDRYAVTRIQPGATLLFFLDSQSQDKSSQMEARIVRSMSRALEEANAYVWVLSSKEFCPDVAEPFYSPEEILQLLQDPRFSQRIKDKRIQYIVLVYVQDLSRGWSTQTHSDPGGMAVYNKRDTQHYAKATVIDPEKTELVGTVVANCSASSGYGIGMGVASSGRYGLCCIFPFAWYGGETEDVSIRTLSTNAAKFLTGTDATPLLKRPGEEMRAEALPTATDSETTEEGAKAEALPPGAKPELMKRIRLRDRAEKDFSDRDLQKMIWERNFFNRHFNPGGNFPNAFADNGDGTVTDEGTGLMWQKAGSPSEMTFDAAGRYVQELNSILFGGYGDWRLPTLEELCSLLEGTPNPSGRFMDSLFDPAPYICWSADENQHYIAMRNRAAFCVNFAKGEIVAGWAEMFPPHHTTNVTQTQYSVRAVRKAE